ncbi:hypothetical protein RIF29_15356 [Crotalaria pallida]|uniref:Uncharacterized protein n=1 Tax=Crotalaria pallida TaxID=3830 RepID=A0AAN9FJZ8_CROPI
MSSSQITIGTQSSSANALNNPDLRKSIIEIKNCHTPGRFSCVDTIQEIIEDHNWCYDGCDKCPNKVVDKENDEYGFPKILDTLLYKKFAFVVDVNQHFNIEKGMDNYNVVTIAANENLICEFEASQSTLEVNMH